MRDRTNNNNGIKSHNSPVQDEMTVNRAISGKKKVPSLHATSGVKMIRRDNENKVGSKLDKVVVEDEQDITIVTDNAAMVLSD